MNHASYFKEYREALGFSSQSQAKTYLSAKDITSGIDYKYIDNLIVRLVDIVKKINTTINPDARRSDIRQFTKSSINTPYGIIKDSGILSRLNNQGRRPEEVLFSWLRGYVMTEYFTPVISKIFGVSIESITQIGDDDLRNIDTFRRTPKADLEISKKKSRVRIEAQSGFQGINDVKEHKVREAKRLFHETSIGTICIHFDIYNGQAAFIQLNDIDDSDVNWVTRQQMEGQSVFSIDQNFFKWRFLDAIPSSSSLEVNF